MAKETTSIENKELDELFEKYRQAPDSYIFVVLADACRKLGRVDEALEICETGLKKHPSYASGHVVRGKCFFDLSRPAEAREAFEEVVRLDGSNLVALKFLGMMDAEAENFDAARRHFERILVLDPDNKEIRQALRIVDEKQPEPKADGAAGSRSGEEALPAGESRATDAAADDNIDESLETSDELASMTLADIFASQGYKDKALAIYREILEHQPHNRSLRAKIATLTGEPLPEPEPPARQSAEPATETNVVELQAGGQAADDTDAAADDPSESDAADASRDAEPPAASTAEATPDDTETSGDSRADATTADAGDDDRPSVIELPADSEFSTGASTHEGMQAPIHLPQDDDGRKGAAASAPESAEPEVPSKRGTGATAESGGKPERPAIGQEEEDLEDEVNRVITLGADPDVATSESEARPVVELPYDHDEGEDVAPDSDFEEMDESRPIKMTSAPARERKDPPKSRARKAPEPAGPDQRHRRKINEKENFNYFKRWLDRMQD